ncbi:MAG: type II toxin-antitoxin system antitoxin SocA domain-containing protein, partial [Pseudomonas sp.]|uniref:Panacea domain-containing protein n=1 Tax=Pseudomonas sp. TaxID=306 RepID=UPI003BB6C56F
MLPSESVANYFIQKSFNSGIPLTSMKLIKLVYIAHGWHCGYFSQNLINDAVEAWKFGPVIPDLYRKVKWYGRGHIDAPIEGYGVVGDNWNPL